MKDWHPYQKSEQYATDTHFKDVPRYLIVIGTLIAIAMITFAGERALFAAMKAPAHKAKKHKTKAKQKSIINPELNAGQPQLPVYAGPYCQTEDSSLIATLNPDESTDVKLLCAANGMDLVHRFVKTEKFPREQILADYKNKISDEFKIPEDLQKRVGFWFDIYTKYPSYMRIVHHSRYPWIVYREFNLTDFLVQPKVQWMNVQAADKFVSREKKSLESRLLHLARLKKFDNLSADDQYLYQLLAEIPGSRAKVFREAARSMRIQTGQMDFYVEALMRKSQYISTMEQIFREANLPTELIRLPLVESSFNPAAVSKAGAAGVWQFMPATARSIMKVTDTIDERRSPVKSTIGAARYLRSTHRMLYNSWPLTIAAYNHGPGGIRKAARMAGSHEIAVIIKKYESKSFNFASKNYYPEFLAALYAEKYQSEIFGRIKQLNKVDFESVQLAKSIKPSKLAQVVGLPLEIILGYNLDLKGSVERDIALPRGYTLHLPLGYSSQISSTGEPAAEVAFTK